MQQAEKMTLRSEDFVIVGCEDKNAEAIARPSITYWQDAWRRLKKNPVAMVALAVIALLVVMVIIGPSLRGYDFITMNPPDRNLRPSSQYWFGTDSLGRDLFSRVWYAARVSIIVALACTFIQMVVGSLYGGLMAYRGGWLDQLMMKVIVVFSSMPNLLIIILIMMVVGNTMIGLMVALCITAWCDTARLIRGQILQLKNYEYVLASKKLGGGTLWIIVKHLLPNTIGVLILSTATSVPSYIFMESTLSFLGIGLQAPAISLGVLISAGQQTMDFHTYQLIFPALVLCVTVLAINLLGDGLRDALDPRLRQ